MHLLLQLAHVAGQCHTAAWTLGRQLGRVLRGVLARGDVDAAAVLYLTLKPLEYLKNS